MEMKQVDQSENMFMETNVKLVHVPYHKDVEKQDVEMILGQWKDHIGELDFTNVNVLEIKFVFIGKYEKEKND